MEDLTGELVCVVVEALLNDPGRVDVEVDGVLAQHAAQHLDAHLVRKAAGAL